jgi:hypothetical protein
MIYQNLFNNIIIYVFVKGFEDNDLLEFRAVGSVLLKESRSRKCLGFAGLVNFKGNEHHHKRQLDNQVL